MLQVAIMDMEMTALVATLRADIHTPPNGNGAEQPVQHNLQRFNCICLRLMQLGVNQRQICADLQICLLHTHYIYKKNEPRLHNWLPAPPHGSLLLCLMISISVRLCCSPAACNLSYLLLLLLLPLVGCGS